MINCPNKNSKSWKKLSKYLGNNGKAIATWNYYNGDIPDSFYESEKQIVSDPKLEQVEELFESNPELADQVYETLGFKKYSLETEQKLALTERLRDIFKNKSTVLFKAGENTDAFYIDLVKTSDNRYFYFSEMQSPEEISQKRFSEEIQFIDGQIATTEEKDKFINSYLEIADLNQISENPLLSEEEKSQAQKDILKKITPQQKQQAVQTYSTYLNTIFPDSKIKDIVYHTTPNRFDKFDKNFIGKGIGNTTEGVGFYFSNRENSYEEYKSIVNVKNIEQPDNDILYKQYKDLEEAKQKLNNYLITKLNTQLNLDNIEYINEGNLPLEVYNNYDTFKKLNDNYFNLKNEIQSSAENRSMNEDGVSYEEDVLSRAEGLEANFLRIILNIQNPKIFNTRQSLKNNESLKNNDGTITNIGEKDVQYVVFEPEQIHILGSKQDIENFKDFVDKKNNFITLNVKPSENFEFYNTEILLNNENIGYIKANNTGYYLDIVHSFINEEERKKGYAISAYIELGNWAAENNLTLRSNEEMHQATINLWEKLVSKGLAEKVENRYEYVKQVSDSEELIESYNNLNEEDLELIDNISTFDFKCK